MPKYALMCLYKQDSKNAKIPNMLKFWRDRVLIMRALQRVQNLQEYALTEVWIDLEF